MSCSQVPSSTQHLIYCILETYKGSVRQLLPGASSRPAVAQEGLAPKCCIVLEKIIYVSDPIILLAGSNSLAGAYLVRVSD